MANLPKEVEGASLAEELKAFFGTMGTVRHVHVSFHGQCVEYLLV